MMGTGEAEGEKRAEEATNAALLNPLIDEYSLKGAKGLLVNITGGTDLTLFEVDEAVNKIRAEVDPEAELIFGSIEDESLNGKIRVSIVATSLDGQSPQTKPIISMVHKLQNRNNGYVINNNASNQSVLNATDGATALNINIEPNKVDSDNVIHNEPIEENINKEEKELSVGNISIENAEYLQNIENASKEIDFEVDSIELKTPELFSEEENNSINQDIDQSQEPRIFDDTNLKNDSNTKEPEMFDESNQEEDFEIPAFLRNQKN